MEAVDASLAVAVVADALGGVVGTSACTSSAYAVKVDPDFASVRVAVEGMVT
jgi:hypothetical protein